MSDLGGSHPWLADVGGGTPRAMRGETVAPRTRDLSAIQTRSGITKSLLGRLASWFGPTRAVSEVGAEATAKNSADKSCGWTR